jgi:hypothetical protein
MHPNESMSKVIDGKRYNVKTATLIASNEYWDGSNWERHGTNLFLYKTPRGAFFTVYLTQWQGDRDKIEPITREQAIKMYGDLPEQIVEFEEAFDQEAEEPSPGRPTLYDEKLIQTAVWLTQDMIDWLRQEPGSASEIMRKLIEEKMGS